jgi:uncharacterized membrane protein
MSELIVFAFDSESGAGELRDELKRLQKEHVLKLEDAAVVIRKKDGKVKVNQATSLVGVGALGGSFWGLLIGLLFMAPWLGLAVGAVTGAIAGKSTDFGLDDEFIKEVGETVEPGHSALFLLVREITPDKVLDDVKRYNPKVLRTSLSQEDEAKLKEAFASEGE